jgi:class 3 adenylate cyclase/tetratricopeptide (TPR) repeat protein
MQCPQCQQVNPPQAKFCLECGARLALACAHCGTDLPASAKFCLECGQPAGARAGSSPVPRPATRFGSPRAYTPQHLADRIISSRTAIEGERKQVTVLFADLKGSLELLADRDPEDARRILDPVLERMMEAVHRYEGTVNQVMGDGIMALFGAPLAHEDHAVRACYAALRMQETVQQYADEVRRAQGLLIQIRVGLNAGEVVVRSIGSDLRMDYTAVGQTTHLAARMEQLALPGTILLAPDTLRLVEGYAQVKALGPMPVKGRAEPIEVYELLGAGAARSRFQATAARGLTRFVGREAELDLLRRTLEQAGAGHGQVVALVGEPGVGKSRLVWEFGHSHRTQGWLALEAGSVSYGKATSYLPVIDLLKSYCGVETRDDPRRMREKLAGKVLMLDRALEPTLPALLSILDVPVEDAQWQALDPPQRRQRTLDGLKRLLLRESQEQPLLLVFEDLHWIDTETQALLDGLVDSLPTARVLLLVNYRPEYEHGWHHKSYYRELRLDPLPPEGADELLQALLGNDAELAPLKTLLIQRTEGNPFFLEESVRTLVETGALAGERGAFRLAQLLQSIQVPATVQAVLGARIDRLAPEDKRLLQCAAVIGKDVPHALLRAIAELPQDALPEGLARLQAAEFLYETSLFPDLEYTFKHALTHEVAYGTLLQERRRAVHGQIVAAIGTLYPDRLAEQVERLAYHSLRGELWDQAVDYLQQAGAKAAGRSAHREAVAYFEQALAALGHLPESRATMEQAIDLRFDLRNSLLPLGEIPQILSHLREAEATAEALIDTCRLGRVAVYRSHHFWWIGQHERCVQSGECALAIARTIGDFAIEVQANHYLGLAFHGQGSYRRAAGCLRTNVESIAEDRIDERFGLSHCPALVDRGWLAESLAEQGEFDAGMTWGEEAVRLADAVNHPFTSITAYGSLGKLYVRKGDLERATAMLDRALTLCRQSHNVTLFAFWGPWLAYADALSGRVADAVPLARQAVDQATSIEELAEQSIRVACLGEVYLLAGHWEDALQAARHALDLARRHRERGDEAWVLRLLGEIAAHGDPPDAQKAERYYRDALGLAEELGMRPLVAHCHLGLGTLYRKIGRREQAQTELTTAAEMYRAMEMTFWLAKAATVLAQMAD